MILICKRERFIIEKNLRQIYDVFVQFNNKSH